MKTFYRILFFYFVVTSFFISGCATDGAGTPPMLDLSPEILTVDSEVGDGVVLQLEVSNQINHNSTSAFAIENDLTTLFTDLITDSFENQEYKIIKAEDVDDNTETTTILVIIKELNNQIESSSLTSNIIANVAVDVVIKSGNRKLSRKFSSTRTQEVALKASIDEVTKLTELAVAKIIQKVVTDAELRKFVAQK